MSKTQNVTEATSIVDYDLTRDYDGCSIGITVYDGDTRDLDSLIYQGFTITTVTIL